MSYVRIDNVCKQYNDLAVLRNVSLTIDEGEFITLLGPSGCGKSTLLRAIAGLTDIDVGSIYVENRDITYVSPKERMVGMVFQSYALFPNMSAFNNIAFGLKMEGMRKEQYAPLVEEMLELIDLKGRGSRYPYELSGGQQQRVALGRALVKRPKVLLLDEPLSALDAKIRRTLRAEIRKIQQRLNMTTIFVTHDQEEALTISDRIYVMNHGTIEQFGKPHEIYTSPKTEYVARFIGNYNIFNDSEIHSAQMSGVPQGHLFAVRPEAISIALDTQEKIWNGNQFITGVGRVNQVSVLGNVIRFDVDVNGLKLIIDALHDTEIHNIKENSKVTVAIPLSECKPLNHTG